MSEALGRHLLAELHGCDSRVLDDAAAAERLMVDAARAAGATVISTSFHHFAPHGVSGVVVIQESHLAVHTWPEHGFAAVDLFTCGEAIDPWITFRTLRSGMVASRASVREVPRGEKYLLPDGVRQGPRRSHVPGGPLARNLWFTTRREDIALSLRHAGTLFSEESPFQKVEVLNTYGYGKMLAIDNAVMFTERDESAYHEMVAHVPMLTHPDPARVLLVGGGDGGAARELLRHRALAHLVVVEIDETVVEAARAHFPAMSSAFADPRLELEIADGADFVSRCPDGAFDVVVVDAAPPGQPADSLFTDAFYANVRRCLTPDGVMVSQAEPPSLASRTLAESHSRQAGVFGAEHVHCYLAAVPTYTTGLLALFYAGKGKSHPLHSLSDRRASAFASEQRLRYYNTEVHRGSFALPTFLRELLGSSAAPGACQ